MQTPVVLSVVQIFNRGVDDSEGVAVLAWVRVFKYVALVESPKGSFSLRELASVHALLLFLLSTSSLRRLVNRLKLVTLCCYIIGMPNQGVNSQCQRRE